MANKLQRHHLSILFLAKNLRKFWLNLHLMLALSVGFVFVIFGLTGSFNIFYYELNELGLPAIKQSSQDLRSLDDVMQTVKAANPQRNGGWAIVLPGYLSDYLWIEYPKPEETQDELFAPLEILVNPYTSEIIDQHFWGQTLFSLIYELHADFMMGKIGKEVGELAFKVVCFFGVFLFISCLSGLYLWWPRTGKFKQALSIKPNASRERYYFDLHKITGFYSSVLLLILAFTGFAFSYKDYVTPLVSVFSPIKKNHLKNPPLKSEVLDSVSPISIAQAVAIADQVFPGAELRGVNTPDGKEGVYMVAKRQAGEANRKRPRSKVWIDQYSGAVLAVQDPNQFTAGETFMNILWPLHDGQILGLTGRILWCLVGFAPLILYITGILRWLQKRRVADKKLAKGA
ncbi:PepSY-associated TM helix domain-containing protein [Methylomonas sp. MS20]|uniref:PepSY-associated TM helix domain-containing protein n=1 Tax=unclassified Methylomonas TaxID=2608980 RepID=UPI0008D989CD|nr:PepSY-associated TM helix domain-containing protein [Methylomonas sp. LWB]OHX36442.1 peptidase [Methylomonas sp. LWB]